MASVWSSQSFGDDKLLEIGSPMPHRVFRVVRSGVSSGVELLRELG